MKATAVRFAIVDGDRVETFCSFAVPGEERNISWYAQSCGRDFTISWGYKSETDSAVMTVCQ